MPFHNRTNAGRRLATALASFHDAHPIILGLARGGLPVAAEVASALDASLDVILVRKIGVPWQPELAMGAVVDGAAPFVIRNEGVIASAGVSETAFAAIHDRALSEIERRRKRYIGNRVQPEIRDRTVIVIDDGIATGASTRAALQAIRAQKPEKLILAVPVAPEDTLEALKSEADEVICLEPHRFFTSVGACYTDFSQVDDEQVIAILKRFS